MTNSPSNIKGLTAWDRTGRETAALIPAELISMGVSLGVVAVADAVDRVAPNAIKTISSALSKAVFEPYLDTIEWGLSKFCKLESAKVDTHIPRAERAEHLARTTLVFSAAWAASMIAKLNTRSFINDKLGVAEDKYPGKKWWQFWKMTSHEKVIFGMDESVHYGSMLLLNTAGAKVTDDMIHASRNVLVKCGMSDKLANELSHMTFIWELPNALGLASGMGGIYGIHHHQWDKKVEKNLDKFKQWATGTTHMPQPPTL